MVVYKCFNCGKTVYKRVNKYWFNRNKRHFCSRECYYDFLRRGGWVGEK